MSNSIKRLRYIPSIQKVETEEKLLKIFRDLREKYNTFSQTFEISTPRGEPLKDFEYFLKFVVREENVVLTGSGNIDGLDIKNESVEYDLSLITRLTEKWDINRNGSCYGCHNIKRKPNLLGELETYCAVKVLPMKWINCPKYNPIVKDGKGKPARKLDDLIAEATKN